jgi:membrane protein
MLIRALGTLKTAIYNWIDDGASAMGAALAYYALFSLTPILIIAIAVAGTVYGEDSSRNRVLEQVREFTGEESAYAVGTMLDNFHRSEGGLGAWLVGIFSLWFGATGIFTQLRTSLNHIWRVESPAESVLVGLVKTYLLAVLMVLASCIFLLVLLMISTVLPLVWHWESHWLPKISWVGPVGDFAISTVVLTVFFAFLFRFMSDGRVRYRHVWGGAFTSAFLFSVGKLGIGYYISYVGLASAYGAAGSLVVFLVWVYYSAQILLFGAEVVRLRLGR